MESVPAPTQPFPSSSGRKLDVVRGARGVFLKGSHKLVIIDTFGLTSEAYAEEGFCGAIDYVSCPRTIGISS